jgi:hypothetical protein
VSDPNLSAQPDPGQMGAIEVKTSYLFIAFLMSLFPAKASINGSAPLRQGWGAQVYPMPAGRHQVRVWCPYIIKLGDSTHVVDVYPGQATVVEWKCPLFILSKGQWFDLGVRPIDPNTLPAGHAHGAPMPVAEQLPAGTGAVQPVPTTGPPEAEIAPAAAENPAGWHPDPHGQAALRYWDGQQWTEHTSDGQAAAG